MNEADDEDDVDDENNELPWSIVCLLGACVS